MVRPTVNSEKHIVQIGFNNAPIGSVRTQPLILAKTTPSSSTDVRVGATVKAIYVEMWFQGEGMASGTSIAILEKLESGLADVTTADMLLLNNYGNKKNIFWTHQGLSSDQNTNAVPVIRGWVKIPKGKQRFGLDDAFKLQIQAQVDGVNICGLAIFKEYF